jgi:hypothetical protein
MCAQMEAPLGQRFTQILSRLASGSDISRLAAFPSQSRKTGDGKMRVSLMPVSLLRPDDNVPFCPD